ncbi:MAG: RNA methyltransferase [Cyclobacteriaceae bacterium]|nr:RNA methyltransferase [Cyclobacteriaceae bacterium]
MDKTKYLEYLESYLSPNRKSLFDRVCTMRTRHFTIVAEDTYQDHNASAMVRSCDCFGIQDVHIIEEINRYRLAKGMTQGAEKWVDTYFYSAFKDNTQSCIDTLRQKGYAIVATTPHGADCQPADFDIHCKSAFFFGKERLGLSDKVLEQADYRMKIPLFGFTESFNISVSVALLLQSVTGRLHQSRDIDWHLSREEIQDLKIKWCLRTIQHSEQISNRYLAEN